MDSGQVRLRGKRPLLWGIVCAVLLIHATAALGVGFSPQQRLGFSSGDQWEPAVAADGYGHIYVLYPQYIAVPGCPACPAPSMVLQISNDNGVSWKPPRPIAAPRSSQFDAQIVIDPADRETVYAAWLENDKSDIALAKSVDFGETWTVEIAVRNRSEVDRPVLAIRGRDIYVGYGQSRELGVVASHDGGLTFAASTVNPNPRLGSSLAGGGTVDPNGNVFFAWAGYLRSGPRGPVVLYVAKSADGAKTWNNSLLDVSAPSPACAAQKCGWAYLGAQITMTSDAAGTLYALWNAGTEPQGAERIYFASSTTSGVTWSRKQDVSREHRAWSMLSPRLSGEKRATCVSPGWMRAIRVCGTPIPAVRPTVAQLGRRKPDFQVTSGATLMSNAKVSTFPLATTSGWRSTTSARRTRCGARASITSLPVPSGIATDDKAGRLPFIFISVESTFAHRIAAFIL